MDGAGAGRRPGAGLRLEAGQFVFLTRHFFGRLFRNEIVDFADQVKERLIAVLAILAIIVGWMTELLLFKYHFLPDTNLSWQEKSYVLTMVMILFAIVTLLEWDILFPDRRDFLNLSPLPVRLRTIFAAKLGSFILFVGLFSAAMNSMSAVLFPMYLAQWRANSLVFAARYLAAHLVSAYAACFFVFFACVFLHFFLAAALPFGIYRRVSLLVRFVLAAVFIFLLLAFIAEPALVDKSFQSLAALKASGAPLVFRFPPLWFVGLYEVLLGTSDPVFKAEAGTAVLAVVLSLGAFVLASALSYYRHVVKTLEASKGAPPFLSLREAAGRAFARVALKTPEERAVALFFSRTLRTSPKHRMTLAYYMAAAAAFVMLFVAGYKGSFGNLTPGNGNLLVQPLFLAFVLLAGLRSVVNIPVAPGANWIFQVSETAHPFRYASGLRKAIFFQALMPLFAVVFLVHLLLWDWRTALGHAIFGLTISGLVLQMFFFRYRKIPFACACVPGKAKLQTRGVMYLFAFMIFLAAMGALERTLLAEPSKFAGFFLGAGAAWAAFHAGNVRAFRKASLLFEEEPEPALLTFPES